jgi:outer membrane protein OmpA-like peptidoglycan-associated protein
MYFQVNERTIGGVATPVVQAACPAYQPGEIAKSRTAAGHVTPDVIADKRGTLIRDFGVDWRHVKDAVRNEPALRTWLDTMVQVVRANPTTRIRLLGFSDCVGGEANNVPLRRGRAMAVRGLLQQMAGANWSLLQPRISIDAGPAGKYIVSNATPEGRVNNRSVLIESVRSVTFEPEVVTGTRTVDTIDRIVRRGLDLVQRLDNFGERISVHQQQRIRCILMRLSRPGFDDRYLTGQGVLDFMNNVNMKEPYYANATQWLLPEFAKRSGKLTADKTIWQTLIRIDGDIFQGRHTINRYFHTHGAATPKRIQQMRDWVDRQQNDERSVYRCYR